jgi:hypothetical protein
MRSAGCLKLFTALVFAAMVSPLAEAIPAGTRIDVRLDRTVSSRDARVGDAVACSLASDLVVEGHVLARAGHPLRARVTYVRHSGRFHHAGYIAVRRSSIDIDGERYDLRSSAIRDKGDGHTRSNLEKSGGGAGRHQKAAALRSPVEVRVP